ncbi:lipopolysaccharide assembly protein LapA domain-containing protein [Liquorilactobacillus capillatus]|uniref:Lipopolysaccharide assembly protein A domain-containing protein n=1 Tax=Liquorilactobacillus capillatus DSM 19910 TaxID=1423731 RepID=A0A0R1M5T0_9LACO|nr:lipopolysaccharide assembly protein LapA domain-containing protein [Liquorilactobacillus capillatus]KRL03225.1 hypothetical protein FC81_GL000228 [Liquorilactobacillus capillatus DSM 19910]
MKNQGRLIAALVVTLLIVIFALLNTQAVEISLGFWKFSLPLVLVLIVSVLLGVLIAFLMATVTTLRLKSELKESRQRTADIKDEERKRYEKQLAEVTAKYQRRMNKRSVKGSSTELK